MGRLSHLLPGARWPAAAIAMLAIVAAAFAMGRLTAPLPAELAAKADFVFSDAMIDNLESPQELALGPTLLGMCIGGSLAIANASSATVGLTLAPNESDNLVHLGIVKPGGIIPVSAPHPGTYFIGIVGRDGALLRFDVVQC
jgi:hypothetical protein